MLKQWSEEAFSHSLTITSDTRNMDREKSSGQTHRLNVGKIKAAMDKTKSS
jgi:hypothetical protein